MSLQKATGIAKVISFFETSEARVKGKADDSALLWGPQTIH